MVLENSINTHKTIVLHFYGIEANVRIVTAIRSSNEDTGTPETA